MRWVVGLLLVIWVMVLVPSRVARADEVAPELERDDLRTLTQREVERLSSTLPVRERQRLAGTYAAFDPNVSDPFAQVACDDDGDHVIVLSEAMLRLIAHVARAISYDEANGAQKTEDYASFVARSQMPGRRWLPPPPGFYDRPSVATSHEERLGDVLAFVVGREFEHLRARDLVCPKPTATKESGDDVWTSAEQHAATASAATTYPGRPSERDADALSRAIELGHSDKGAFALLRFFARLELSALNEGEAETRTGGTRAAGSFRARYLSLHPGSSKRASDLTKVVEARASRLH